MNVNTAFLTMAISKDKVRMNITIPRDLKQNLEVLAKDNNRSLNNLIVTVMQKHLEETESKK